MFVTAWKYETTLAIQLYKISAKNSGVQLLSVVKIRNISETELNLKTYRKVFTKLNRDDLSNNKMWGLSHI